MKKLFVCLAALAAGFFAKAQDLNDIHLALTTVQDSAHFYYYVNMYPKLGQWDIKRTRPKEYGYFSEYTLEGKFDRIWLLSPHDAIIKKNGKYALFNLDTKKYTTKFEYLDVRFAWGGPETAPVALYSKTKDYEGWELVRLLDTDGKRTMEPVMTEPADSFNFIARNCIKIFHDGKEALINDKNEVVVPYQYAHIGNYIIYDGVTLIDVQNEEGLYGLARIKWDGTIAEIAPCEYDAVHINRWPCLLEKDGKFAIVYDKYGARTDLVFDAVDWYPQGMIVRIGDKFGFQKWGKLKLEIEYDTMEIVASTETKNKKAIAATKSDGDYLYDTNAKLLSFTPVEIPAPADSLVAPADSLVAPADTLAKEE
ncbi:MAG: hypothetical protein J5626_05670 [Lachnospiraceae bacterium]|nr:hypothetical protein [Lachnospiraceae bacterium]